MNDNNDDNIVSFPTEKRLKDIEAEREKTKPTFGQFGYFGQFFTPNNVNMSITFEEFDFTTPVSFPKDTGVNFGIKSNLQDNRILNIMDMCNYIQKRAVYHYSHDNHLVFNQIESLLEQLIQISNFEDKKS